MNKNHFSFALALALLFTVFTSCRKGEKGEPGPAGPPSSTPAYREGFIKGTLEGTTSTKDSAFALNLDYQYYKDMSDNFTNVVRGEGTFNKYTISRYDSTGNAYIKFEFSLYSYDNSDIVIDDEGSKKRTTVLASEIYNTRITLVTTKKLNTNNLFYFATVSESYNPFNVASVYLNDFDEGENSYIEYDNISLNSATGELSFDYSLRISSGENSTGNAVTMTGTVDAAPYNVQFRQGSAD